MGMSPHSTTTRSLAAAASALLVAAVYVLRLNRAAGLAVDDAWYVLLGQSLADGRPFALISSAAAPILPSVPPVFPAILATVFAIVPTFPDNIWLLKSVSIAAMLGAGGCTFLYARRERRLPMFLAGCVAIAVTLTPAFVFLATSTVMAECVFTVLQLASVLVVERAAADPDEPRARRTAAMAGALAAMTWLVRSAGIVLIAAALLRLVRTRRWPIVAMFVFILADCAVPWLIYSQLHQPTAADRDRNGGSIAVSYGDAIRLRIAGTASSGRISPGELPRRAARNALNVFGRDIGGIIAPVLYRPAIESGEEVFSLGALGFLAGSMGNAPLTIALSLLLSAVVIAGYVADGTERLTVVELLVPLTISMVLVYPYWTFRFILPLAPFIFIYLLSGWRVLTSRVSTVDVWRPARVVVLSIVALQLIDHAAYIRVYRDEQLAQQIEWVAESRDIDRAFAWMQANLADTGSVASTNPALVYLHTGRKGVTFDGSTLKLDEWKALGIRYVASFRSSEIPQALKPSRVVYRDVRRRWWIVDLS